MQHWKKNIIIQLICNPDGSIAKVASDSSGFFGESQVPPELDVLMTPSAKKRYFAFLDEVQINGYGLCDAVILQNGARSLQFSLFGVHKNNAFHLIALQAPQHLFQVFEDFMHMLNEQGVLLREAQKKASMPIKPDAEKIHLLEECMVINNELAKKQRELAKNHKQLQRAYISIEELSVRDTLTGAANRRKLLDVLLDEMSRCKRYGTPLSVLSLDIDFFKRVNDVYGHAAGDSALIAFVKTCQDQLRTTDMLGRIGGEEFIALLPHTPMHQATTTAQRIRSSIEELSIGYNGSSIRITVSVGVSTFKSGEDMDSLLNRADTALYQAKAEGRNRVVSASTVNDGSVEFGHE